MKKCKVCEKNENETKIISSKKYGILCRKHYLQMYKHGKIARTIHDPNRFILEYNIVRIELYDTKGNVTGYGIVDAEDLELVKNIKWYCKNGYVRGGNPKRFLHRWVLGHTGEDGRIVDHIDGNPLDCRKSNLRLCEHKDNIRNQKHRTTENQHTGVTQVPSGNWIARIMVDYKSVYLGTYSTRELAIKVRLVAELKYFGEFSPNN